MKYSIALLTFTIALNVSAGCPMTLSTESPAIPDGTAASEGSMHTAKEAVQTYVEDIEYFLECRGPRLSSRVHNKWVDKALEAADTYNLELHRYEERQEALAKY